MTPRFDKRLPLSILLLLAGACGSGDRSDDGRDQADADGAPPPAVYTLQDSTHRVAVISGLSGPEAVRYDPDQDVYFISNFNGDGDERDSNGFISRATADGSMEVLRFMEGTEARPLHAPRGMYISGAILWVADVDGLHGFDRRSGEQVHFVDLSSFEPGFLNDVAAGPDGVLYVTDTGSRGRLYRIEGLSAELALEDSGLGPPNGITWDSDEARFLVAPWGAGGSINAWRPGSTSLEPLAEAPEGQIDGIEVVQGQIVVASQSDRRLHIVENGGLHPVIAVPGDPADIGVDTRRSRIAVPYIGLGRVDIWDWRPSAGEQP